MEEPKEKQVLFMGAIPKKRRSRVPTLAVVAAEPSKVQERTVAEDKSMVAQTSRKRKSILLKPPRPAKKLIVSENAIFVESYEASSPSPPPSALHVSPLPAPASSRSPFFVPPLSQATQFDPTQKQFANQTRTLYPDLHYWSLIC